MLSNISQKERGISYLRRSLCTRMMSSENHACISWTQAGHIFKSIRQFHHQIDSARTTWPSSSKSHKWQNPGFPANCTMKPCLQLHLYLQGVREVQVKLVGKSRMLRLNGTQLLKFRPKVSSTAATTNRRFSFSPRTCSFLKIHLRVCFPVFILSYVSTKMAKVLTPNDVQHLMLPVLPSGMLLQGK